MTRICRLSRLFLIVMMGVVLVGLVEAVSAQGVETPHYWQYETGGVIQSVHEADAERDGYPEFFVISAIVVEDDPVSRVELVRGNGVEMWGTSLDSEKGVVSAEIVQRFVDSSTGSGQDSEVDRPVRAFALLAMEAELMLYDLEQGAVWDEPYVLPQAVISAESFDHNIDREDSVLVRFTNGQLSLYGLNQQLIWAYRAPGGFFETGSGNAPNPLVTDIINGEQTIFYAYETSDKGRLVRLSAETGDEIWSKELDSRATALIRTTDGLAVSTETGIIQQVTVDGELSIERDEQAKVTALASIDWQGAPILFVGTADGRLNGYRMNGARIVTRYFCPLFNGIYNAQASICANESAGQVQQISVFDHKAGIAPLGRLAVRLKNNIGLTETVILDDKLLNIGQYSATDAQQPNQLVDVNKDGQAELLLPRFSELELLSFGTQTSSTVEEWDYSLNGLLTSVAVADFDNDNAEELVIGANFKVHLMTESTSSPQWVDLQPGIVSHLALLPSSTVNQADGLPNPPTILVGYNVSDSDDSGDTNGETDGLIGIVTLFRSNQEEVWQPDLEPSQIPIVLDAPLTALYLDTLNPFTPTLILGTATGNVSAYQLVEGENGWRYRFLWKSLLAAELPIQAITRLPENQDRYTLVTERNVYQLGEGEGQSLLVDTISLGDDACAVSTDLLYMLRTSIEVTTSCFTRTLEEWTDVLGTTLDSTPHSTERFNYRPLSETTWQRVTRISQAQIAGDEERAEAKSTLLENVAILINQDLNGDDAADVAFAVDNTVVLDLNEESLKTLRFVGNVKQIAALRSGQGSRSDYSLAVMTDNGKLSMYRFRPDFPPLLTNPSAESDRNDYRIAVNAQDVEQGRVAVTLQLLSSCISLNPDVIHEEVRNFQAGNEIVGLEWVVDQSVLNRDNEEVCYQFIVDDGKNSEVFRPPAGPQPTSNRFLRWNLGTWVSGASIAVLSVAFLLFLRAWNQPPAVARRIHAQIRNEPNMTLPRMQTVYEDLQRPPELLLNLASTARRREDPIASQISDGLFLLDSQPMAGISLVKESLEAIYVRDDLYRWQDVRDWGMLFDSAEILLTAPTLSELTLYEPQLDGFIDVSKTTSEEAPSAARLRPIFESLKASTRVESDEDRLTYLNDAAALLRRLESEVDLHPRVLSVALTRAVVDRWLAMTRGEIETLRGRARLDIELKTELVSPSETVPIAIDIENHGRAAAEQVQIELLEGAATPINGATAFIPYLAPGRRRTVQFDVQIPEDERFRIAFEVTYNDSHRQGKTFDYANIVNVLTPARDFTPINNPYSPGTPLRKNSDLFFGRENLFGFIADTAQNLQKKVLIMVGQRRTGKTSALLRLSDHLPPELLSVYIDCQSLGVVPGMEAFVQDVVWAISDALALRGIDLDVPDLSKSTQNPSTWFEREFVPHLHSMLPENTQILLVFDEFEAFENLVNDGILPSNFFPYLRHLMQHAEGLGFVFVGTHRLEQMTVDYWSVLFNIALYKEITYLSREKAYELIEKPVAGSLLYDDLALDKIWRLTAGHPYFLQLVCYGLVKQANELKKGYVTISDVNSAVSGMLGLGEVHFAYLWNESSLAEKNLLTAIAHLIDNEIPFRPDELLTALAPYNVVLSPSETTAALTSLVQRHILNELSGETTPTYEVNLALIEHWVEQTKGLGTLFT